jgi:parallel beta-helix repeat protein
MFNSNSVVKNNSIYTDPNSTAAVIAGIRIAATTNSYTPIIDLNYIENDNPRGNGINKGLGSSPTIKNNVISLKGTANEAINIGIGGISRIMNNLIIAENGYDGIYGNGSTKVIINNYITGNLYSYGINNIGPGDTVKNNVITNCGGGISVWNNQDITIQNNNAWRNDINNAGFVPDTTNLSVDPMIVNDDSTQGELDFRLQMYSPLIDAGDPTILDRDGSRSDIGLYGGPYGWTYTYQDLAPRPPHNVTAAIEEGLVKLTWNKNTEADFSHYRIYRDTVTIVIYDSTKMIAETPDTFYYDQLPPVNKETRFYYVITAFDNQGNQSYPSEEINVLVTGLGEHPPKGYDGYRLLANYPNPFNPSTKIPYRLKERGHVRLSIYDLKGELVRILVNEWQERGYYEVVFQPNTEDKNKITKFEVMMGKTYNHLSSGMYIYRIQVIDERNIPVFTDSEKMILLK